MTSRQRKAQSRRNAQALLAACEQDFIGGNDGALLLAINWCAGAGLPLPKWAAAAFQTKYRNTVWESKHRSWDAVFGKPNKGKNFLAADKAERSSMKIYERVRQLRAKRPKPARIFKTVADEMRMSERTVKRCFEDFRKFYFG